MPIRDPAEQSQQNQQVLQYLQSRASFQDAISPRTAASLSGLIRTQPSLTATTATAIALSGVEWENQPWLQDLALRDQNAQDTSLMSKMRGLVRGGFIIAESLWQSAPINQGLRVAVRMGQGEELTEAWRKSGASWTGRIAREWAKGNPINMGNGWLPNSTRPIEQPGAAGRIQSDLKAGYSLADASARAETWATAKYGTPITQDYDRVAESTLLTKTVDGQSFYSPVSLGRVAAISVFDPGSVPFMASSGLIDFSARIGGLDPVDIPFKEFGLWRAAKNNIVPQEAAQNVRNLERKYLEQQLGIEPAIFPTRADGAITYGQTSSRAAIPGELMDDLTEQAMASKNPSESFKDIADLRADPDLPRQIEMDPTAHALWDGKGPRPKVGEAGSLDPYQEAYALLDQRAQELHGMSYDEFLYTKYGDMSAQQWDETLTHELIHAEQWDADLVRAAEAGDEDAVRRLTEEGPWRSDEVTNPARQKFLDDRQVYQDRLNAAAAEKQAADAKLREAQERFQAAQRSEEDWGNMTRAQRQKEVKRMDELEKQLDDAINERGALNAVLESRKAELKQLNELIDSRTWSEFDATYRAGLKLMAGESASAQARKMAMREYGITSAWRPWLKPQLVEDYLTSGRGKNTIRWLADNTSLAAQRKVLNHGVPASVQAKIAKATKEHEVIELLAPYLGKEIQGVPLARKSQRVGQSIRNSRASQAFQQSNVLPSSVPSVMSFRGGLLDKVSTGVHRLGSRAVKLELNPYDIEQTLDHATAWMRTIRASDQEVDEVLYMIIAESNKAQPSMDKVYDHLTEMFIRKFDEGLEGRSLSDAARSELIAQTMRDWRKGVMDNKVYNIDAVGNRIDDVDREFAKLYMESRNADVPVPRYSAVMESQTAMTNIVLPSGTQVRRATSGLHQMTQSLVEKVLQSNRFANEGEVYKAIERLFPGGLQSSFGIGFLDGVHKVWRDMALLRIGWPLRVIPEEMLRQAAAGYSMFITSPLSYIALMMKKHISGDLLGDSLDDLLTLEAVGSGHFRALDDVFDARRQSWTVVHPGQKGYREGLAREYIQLHGDEIARTVADRGVEETIELLTTTDEGAEIIRRVTQKGGQALDISTPEGLRLYVERAEANIAQMTGGEWIRKGSDGKLYDMAGGEIRSWDEMTKAELHAEINARRAARGESPLTAKPTSYSKQHWIDTVVNETGIPVAKDFDGTYMVLRQGDEQLRGVIGRGAKADGEVILHGEMKPRSRHEWDAEDFEQELERLLEASDVAPPSSVRAPRNALEKTSDMYNGTVDVIFEALMAKPSAELARKPFFRQKYSEELARWYVMGDAELRRSLKAWAADNGVTRLFNKQIREATELAGFNKLPTGGLGIGMDDWEKIDTISKQRSLQATKDLFYDLAERQNLTEMTKYIFPFADAWFEVLSRWANLLFTNAQRAPTNWRRMQVGVTNMRKSGFFSEDEYGREVFNWPGAGLMAPWFTNSPQGTTMDAKVGIDQLMFIDPNPRGLMMPGVGPIIQLPASWVTPAIDDFPALSDAVNWFAFGDFERIEPQSTGDIVKSFIPSWGRQVLTAFLGDEHKKEFGDEVGRWYETLLISNADEFNDDTPDAMRRTLQQARSTGTALSWLKVMDRFMAPATPRYEAAVDAAMDAEDPFWITALALEREWTATQDFFDGDTEAAREMFLSRFGIDPLNLHAGTYRVTDAPATENAYQFLRSNDELYEVAPSTMMAWIDVPEDDEFYNPAWQRQKAEGQRVDVTPEQRAWAINEQTAWHAWNVVRDAADEQKQQVLANTEPRSAQRKRMIDVIDEWKRRRGAEIFEEYFAWDNQQGRQNVGLPQRPKLPQVWDELMQQGTPGTDAYSFTRGLDESMSDFMIQFTELVKIVRETSLSYGSKDWWLESNTPEAKAMQQGFVDKMNLELMKLEGPSAVRGRYVIDRYILPAFEGWDLEDDMFITPSHIEQPETPVWADKVNEPTGPGVGLPMAGATP